MLSVFLDLKSTTSMLFHLVVCASVVAAATGQHYSATDQTYVKEPGDRPIGRASPSKHCETMLHRPDVRELTVRFDRVHVPAYTNMHRCQMFRVPDDQEYHVIGSKFLVDNKAMVHHLILHSCVPGTQDRTAEGQYPCILDAKKDGCSKHLTLWNNFNPYDRCFHPLAGFPIGKGRTSSFVSLNIHIRNDDSVDSYDSSGIIIYFTPKLRRYDMAMMFLGQTSIHLPPGQIGVNTSSVCSSRCTSKLLKGPVKVPTIHPHMHGMGLHENVTIYSPARNTTTIFSYDQPRIPDTFLPVELDTLLTLLPGDEVESFCTYNTTKMHEPVQWGSAKNHEMCFSVVYVFPAENLLENRNCTQNGNVDMCDFDING